MMKSISTWKQELTEGRTRCASGCAVLLHPPTRPLHRQPAMRLFWTG